MTGPGEILTPQQQAAAWNRDHPVGAAVTVDPGNGLRLDTTTWTPAETDADRAVVHVRGVNTPVPLDHIRPRAGRVPTARQLADEWNDRWPRGAAVTVRRTGESTVTRDIARVIAGIPAVWVGSRLGALPMSDVVPDGGW